MRGLLAHHLACLEIASQLANVRATELLSVLLRNSPRNPTFHVWQFLHHIRVPSRVRFRAHFRGRLRGTTVVGDPGGRTLGPAPFGRGRGGGPGSGWCGYWPPNNGPKLVCRLTVAFDAFNREVV